MALDGLRKMGTEEARTIIGTFYSIVSPIINKDKHTNDPSGIINKTFRLFGLKSGKSKTVKNAIERRQMWQKAITNYDNTLNIGDRVSFWYGTGVIEDVSVRKTKIKIEPTGILLEFKSLSGKNAGSARASHYVPSFQPPAREERSDVYGPNITEPIENFHRTHNATSPNTKDVVKRKIGPRQQIEARTIYRYETWQELWNTFQKLDPIVSCRIANPKKPEDVPSIFRTAAPWEMRKGRDTGCLCTTCENLEQIRRGQMATLKILNNLIEKDECAKDPGNMESSSASSNIHLSTNNIFFSKLKYIASILSATSKFDMVCKCLCPPQGNKEGLSRLEDIKKTCLDMECSNCGFARYWSKGIRKNIVETPFGESPSISDDSDDAWSEKVQWRHYVSRPRPAMAEFAAKDCNDGEYSSHEGNTLRDLVLEKKEGTVVDFLDELELALNKNVLHRVILTNDRKARLQFEQIQRPGMFSRDIDFSENGTLKNSRELQSEHWRCVQYSLMVLVLSWLDAKEWDLEEGALEIGCKVTVHGEKSFEKPNKNAFWGKVKQHAGDDKYWVEDSIGVSHLCNRQDLRKRILVSAAIGGISNDKLHDRHHQQHFTDRELQWFEDWLKSERPEDIGVGKIEKPCVRQLSQHMDNAAQHFKSTGAIEYLSSIFEKKLDDDSDACFIITFGCPGHGKGKWDGIGGAWKNFIHQLSLNSLTSEVISNVLYTARNVFDALVKKFESKEWEEKAKAENRAIIKMKFFYAEQDESGLQLSNLRADESYLTHPPTDEVFDNLVGIKNHFQFLPIKTGLLGMRKLRCFCSTCYFNAIENRPSGMNHFVLGDCQLSIENKKDYQYEKMSCKMIVGRRATQQMQTWRDERKKLADNIVEGDFVFFQGDASDDCEEPIWLGQLVKNTIHELFRCQAKWKNESGNQVWMDNVHIDKNDIALNIQWFQRVDFATNYGTFRYKKYDQAPQVQNACQLLTEKVIVTKITGDRELWRSSRRAGQETFFDSNSIWELNDGQMLYDNIVDKIIC